ncbi:MAG: transposase [Pelagibacterales bacterium]|nr:transposase [Pelagibacterales bacterium]
MKERLYNGFDTLFSKTTGYIELDKRIEKTKNKKSELLLVLEFPEIPLHNNASELAVRVQVRKRDVSLQTRTKE